MSFTSDVLPSNNSAWSAQEKVRFNRHYACWSYNSIMKPKHFRPNYLSRRLVYQIKSTVANYFVCLCVFSLDFNGAVQLYLTSSWKASSRKTYSCKLVVLLWIWKEKCMYPWPWVAISNFKQDEKPAVVTRANHWITPTLRGNSFNNKKQQQQQQWTLTNLFRSSWIVPAPRNNVFTRIAKW